MKFNRSSGLYKASNVIFNTNDNTGWSYDWWCLFKNINGKNVLNTYNYSNSTIKHRYKIERLLDELGISIDMRIECPAGLHVSDPSQSVSEHYSDMIKDLKAAMARPRSQAKKNKERNEEIVKLAQQCVDFKLLTEEQAA